MTELIQTIVTLSHHSNQNEAVFSFHVVTSETVSKGYALSQSHWLRMFRTYRKP